MKNRVKYCDVLRFFAILSVIMIHVVADFRDEALVVSKPFYIFLTTLDSFTRLGVPLFFMISGAFMLASKKEETYSEFFKKRVLKLMIPFFSVSVLYYLHDNILNGTDMSIPNFINAFSTNMIKYHLWFMYDMIGIYLLIPFLKKLVQALSEKELLTLIFVIFIGGNCISFINTFTFNLFDISFLTNFMFPNFVKYINYLFLGYYLYHYHKPNVYDKKIYIIASIALLLMPICDYITTNTLRHDQVLVAGSLLPFLVSLAFFIFVKNNYSSFHIPDRIENFCNCYAGLVFYIYMLHVLILEILKRNLLPVISIKTAFSKLIIIIILFLLTTVISFIVSYLIEYIVQLFHKIGRKQNL